jgi:hypothetical protein
MSRLLAMIGTAAGGGLAWELGSRVGLMTAVMLSAVGSGVGLWAGRKLARELGG